MATFSQKTIDAVWEKGQFVRGKDTDKYRKDQCGALIYKASYGLQTEMGWQIDHIKPVSRGGTDHLNNLQPLHWENNQGKGDNWPTWSCTRKS